MNARGRFLCGSRISPASGATLFQPSYAHSAPSIAAPKPATPPRALAATPSQVPESPDPWKCANVPGASKKAPIPTPRTSPILAMVTTSAVRPPVATVVQLSTVTSQMVLKVATVKPLMSCPPARTPPRCHCSSAPPKDTFMKMARPTANAACAPDLNTVNAIQPNRNPTRRPNARRRYT
jgi:hypothetical protein